MVSDGTEKLLAVYQLQQSQLTYINRLGQCLDNVRGNMEALCSGQNVLTGRLQECANRSRLVLRRMERKTARNEIRENNGSEFKPLSKARIKSLLRTFHEIYEVSCSAADAVHRFSGNQKYMADLLGLSVLTIKHFLWREQIFMAVILGSHNSEFMKLVSLYEDKGKTTYSHLPEYHSLRKTHARYNELMTEITGKNIEGMGFSELSGELTKLENLNQQFMGCIDQLQYHVEFLLKEHSV